jgi:hypothetical protein
MGPFFIPLAQKIWRYFIGSLKKVVGMVHNQWLEIKK